MIRESTKRMMALLPAWMKMAKDPNSVGAQFLDAFGVELDELRMMMQEFEESFYIGTTRVDMIDYVFKIPVANENIFNMDFGSSVQVHKEGEVFEVMNATNLRRFYGTFSEPVYIADAKEGYVYLRLNLDTIEDVENAFDAVHINGTAHFEYFMHHIWNPFDEFGYLLGLKRLKGERNAAFKERILDVFRRPANGTDAGLKNGIGRALGIDPATIELFGLKDQAKKDELWDMRGKPTKALRRYARQVNRDMAFTWDAMAYGQAKWQALEEGKTGIVCLPHLWEADLSLFTEQDFQSGIGDNDDLLVTAPKSEDPTRRFKAYVGLRGTVEEEERIDPEIRFRYKIHAEGVVPNEEYPEEVYRYTVKATQVVPLKYTLEASQRFSYEETLRFDDPSKFDFSGIPQPTSSQDVLHIPTHKQVKLNVRLATEDRSRTPEVTRVAVVWEDSVGGVNTYQLNTNELLTSNNALANVEMVNTFVADGKMQLGFGEFYNVTDSRGAWEEARNEGVVGPGIIFNPDGSIGLELPKA